MARIALVSLLLLVSAPAFADDRPRFLMSAAEDLPGVVDAPPVLVAQPPASTVAVLALAGGGDIALSDLVLSAQQAIEKKTALRVQTLDPGKEDDVRACAGDPDCFVKQLRRAGSNADLLLTVSVTAIGEGQVLLGILLVDARSEGELAGRVKIKTGELAEELPPGVSPTRAMTDYIAKVFPANLWGEIASLQVGANEENAEVELRGAGLSCVTPCTIDRVYPGRYEVILKKQGFKPWLGSVELKSGQLGKVSATLEQDESGSAFSSPWFWTAVGVGAVAAGVATVLLVTADSGPRIICIAATPEECSQ